MSLVGGCAFISSLQRGHDRFGVLEWWSAGGDRYFNPRALQQSFRSAASEDLL